MSAPLVLVALALVAAGLRGQRAASDEEQVRATLVAFSRATAAKDYQALCDRVLAPVADREAQLSGWPCEHALEQGLGRVKAPKLIVGTITVNGDTASAQVRTSAEGQTPSDDTLELRRVNGAWRIASLGKATEPGPTP